eukprot:snap_masked-scaffold_15-processed-gene-6.28-mRNA-1 protein AED:1.00 eAED:1.00 QI:0/-1/0/0/-1/1/1/0/274
MTNKEKSSNSSETSSMVSLSKEFIKMPSHSQPKQSKEKTKFDCVLGTTLNDKNGGTEAKDIGGTETGDGYHNYISCSCINRKQQVQSLEDKIQHFSEETDPNAIIDEIFKYKRIPDGFNARRTVQMLDQYFFKAEKVPTATCLSIMNIVKTLEVLVDFIQHQKNERIPVEVSGPRFQESRFRFIDFASRKVLTFFETFYLGLNGKAALLVLSGDREKRFKEVFAGLEEQVPLYADKILIELPTTQGYLNCFKDAIKSVNLVNDQLYALGTKESK